MACGGATDRLVLCHIRCPALIGSTIPRSCELVGTGGGDDDKEEARHDITPAPHVNCACALRIDVRACTYYCT